MRLITMASCLFALALAACGQGSSDADASAIIDATPTADGAASTDGGGGDAAPDQPIAGFGTISGPCDQIHMADLDSSDPSLHRVSLDFGTNRYDDPVERPLLTAGGQEQLTVGNAGGSSVFSEVFAYEVLARCEYASFLKTETQIIYASDGKKTDFLIMLDGEQVGVSVTRAVSFPFDSPYTEEAARMLLTRKLADIVASTANVSTADGWHKQILAYLAYDQAHADMVEQVWDGLDAGEKRDTIVFVITTDGDDAFIYTND